MNNLVKIASRGLSYELFAAATSSSAIRAVFGSVPSNRGWKQDRRVQTPEDVNALWTRFLRFPDEPIGRDFADAKFPEPLGIEQHVFWYGPESIRLISDFQMRGCGATVDVDFKDDDITVRWGTEKLSGGPASARPDVVARWITRRIRRFETFVKGEECMRMV